MGHALPSSLTPAQPAYRLLGQTHFLRCQTDALRQGKPNQNKPYVAGCFNLQEELCSSRLNISCCIKHKFIRYSISWEKK